MWDRTSIKNYAKSFLRKHYVKAFIAVLIVTLLSGGTGNASDNGRTVLPDNNVTQSFELPSNYTSPSFLTNLGSRITNSPIFFLGAGFLSITTVLLTVLMITIGYAVEVGQSRFFLDGFKGDVSISKLFSTFNEKEYLPIVKAQFMRALYTFLWTLLFIVPGVIKGLEYTFVPHILAENPTLSPSEALGRSREITMGHKMEIFILNISFLGWYFIGGLFFGIGVYFVNPYREASYARLYNVLTGKDESGYGSVDPNMQTHF